MEKWKKIYSDEQIKKVQQIELMNLKVIEEVCGKLGVQFFAYGGTLIGVVRHQGFIPWDDDLDIAMPRADYIKFIQEAGKYLHSEYYLQTPYTDKKTPYPYTKLRLKHTKYVEYGYHKLSIEQGLYVDIYPIDNLPDDDSAYYKQYKAYQKLVKLYARRQCPYVSDSGRSIQLAVKKVAKFLGSFVLKIIPQKYLIKKIDLIATKYNECDTVRKGNLNYPKPVNVFYNLFPLKDGQFEGHAIKLPGEWDRHLKSRYGDYMTFPPEEERIGHKPYILDFGKY